MQQPKKRKAESQASVQSQPVRTGTRVMLRGLLSSSNYNNTFGIVKSYDNVASRYVVALEAEKEKEVRVRPHCVRQVEAGEGPCCLRHKVLMQEEVRE
jgi:hypothetical protein